MLLEHLSVIGNCQFSALIERTHFAAKFRIISSIVLLHTANCNTYLSLWYMNKLGVHTCRFSRFPFVFS